MCMFSVYAPTFPFLSVTLVRWFPPSSSFQTWPACRCLGCLRTPAVHCLRCFSWTSLGNAGVRLRLVSRCCRAFEGRVAQYRVSVCVCEYVGVLGCRCGARLSPEGTTAPSGPRAVLQFLGHADSDLGTYLGVVCRAWHHGCPHVPHRCCHPLLEVHPVPSWAIEPIGPRPDNPGWTGYYS